MNNYHCWLGSKYFTATPCFSQLTRIEFPEVIEVSVETGVIASEYIQLSIVGN